MRFELETKRLWLLPLDLTSLELLKQDRRLLESHLGLNPSNLTIDKSIQGEMNEAMNFWIEGVRANPEEYCWLTNWEIILKTENRVVGGIGLHRMSTKNVMVGYVMDINYYNKGIATESLQALKNWVFSHKAIAQISADTPINNLGSQQVLLKNGFVEIERNKEIVHWRCVR